MLKRLLVCLLFCVTLAPALEKEPVEVYRRRRAALRKDLDSGITVLFARKEEDDAVFGFRQEDNFYYLTGLDEPGAILVLVPTADQKGPGEILFLPPRNLVRERWTGIKMGPDEDRKSTRLNSSHIQKSRMPSSA